MSKNVLQKIILTVLLIINFIIYEFLNKQTEKTHIVKLQFEEHIPLIPVFSIPYILFIPFLLTTLVYFLFFSDKFHSLAISCITCQLIAYFFYAYYQTTVIRPDIVSTDIFSKLVKYIYAVDRPYNCFPSLHASLSTVCFFYWRQIPTIKLLAGTLVFLIILSTVFIKQHYVLDVISGVILAILSFYVGQILGNRFICLFSSEKEDA